MWDAGVAIGYTLWPGKGFDNVTALIDRLAVNCHRFVHEKAISCKNYTPGMGYQEAKNRIDSNFVTFNALISWLRSGSFAPSPSINAKRLLELQQKLRSISKVDAVKGLIQIQSNIQTRWLQVRRICALQVYRPRIMQTHENILRKKFTKEGDLFNFSSAIQFRNTVGECTFITTDRADFGRLDFTDLGLPCIYPKIEFVQNY